MSEEAEMVDKPTIQWLSDRPFGRQGACPCGASFADDRYCQSAHARQHLHWACGVPVGYAFTNLLVVTSSSPREWRQAAYQLARLFRREEGYDFVMLPEPRVWRQTPQQPRAYVAVWNERAIALAIMGETEAWGWDNKRDAEGYTHFDETAPCIAIAGIFVCNNYRQRGIGRRLVLEAAKCEKVAPEDIAWCAPLSDGGRALANRIGGEQLRLCGYVPWQ